MRFTLPLLHDRHTHVSFYAGLGAAADLSACRGAGAALARLRKARGRPALATGWNSGLYDLPRRELDKLGPLVVCNLSLHGFLFNSAARELLRRDFPDVADNIDDQAWTERHLERVFGALARGAGGPASAAYLRGLRELGIGLADDMLAAGDGAVLALARLGAAAWCEPGGYAGLGAPARRAVTGLKLFTDGAVGARTAALLRPYLGGGRGLLLHTDAELARLLRRAAAEKDHIAVHAIGDRALAQLLRVLGKARLPRRVKLRVEHAQFITLPQARRARRLGITLCMQPNFSEDSRCYADRLPPAYLRANNPFRMLIDLAGFVPGEDLVFGSDGMPHGARAALQASLFPPYPGQRLTPEEFRAGYCLPPGGPGRLEVRVDAARRRVGVCVRA